MWLAEREPTTIVSADSRQVYRGFDIGTAKPTAGRARARSAPRHRRRRSDGAVFGGGVGRVGATRGSTRRDARAATPLVVGGTGLYLRALFEGLFEEPPLDADRRRRARARRSPSCRHRRAAAMGRRRSIPRARTSVARNSCAPIEIALLTGQRMSELHRDRARPSRWRAALSSGGSWAVAGGSHRRADRRHARSRLARRGAATDADGSGDGAGVERDGIRRCAAHWCAASCRGGAAHEAMLIETRQYAKRQRTWFRHQLPADAVTRLDPDLARLGNPTVASWARRRRPPAAEARRVKIGITCYPTYGGSGAVATELGIALARRGHEIHFITYKQPFRLPSFLPRIYFHEVDVGRYPLFEYPPYDLALAVRMHEVTLAHGLDLLHCHYAIPHATSAWIAKEMLRPDARRHSRRDDAARHGHHDRRPGSVVPPDHEVLDREVGRPHGGVALSADARRSRRSAARRAGSRSFRTSSIPTSTIGRGTRRFSTSRSTADTRVLMHVSNFRPVKRVKDVVRIFARVAKEIPSVLIMVGDGPDRVDAEAEVRELGVQEKVFFLGKIDAVAPLLAGADLFLLPSEQRIVRPERARGAGVWRAGDRHERRRTSRSRARQRDGLPLPRRRHRRNGPGGAQRCCRDRDRWNAMSTLAASGRARTVFARRDRRRIRGVLRVHARQPPAIGARDHCPLPTFAPHST